MKVLVLMGGDSPEREVSLRSGEAVSDAARESGHEVHEYDPIHGYEGLDKFVGEIDVVLPIIHGINGEDGVLQEQLEKRNFKFLGADAKTSRLCFDKIKIKELFDELGIATPEYEIVNKESFNTSAIKQSGLYVLKPIANGSTIDTFIINGASDHVDDSIFNKYPEMLLERLIEGNEITVPILDSSPFPVIEIIPPAGEDFDYENKYNGATQELCPPKNVSQQHQKQAQDLAVKVHLAAGVRHLSRTDIIIDRSGKLWALEINTIPGMNSQSLFPKAAKQAGMSMRQLVEKFIEMASA